MFLAENGSAREQGHKHADNLSFMFYADGAFRALDPGYIKWDRRDEVRFGIDHNVVAIDGVGPPAPGLLAGGVDAFITAADLSQWPQYAVGTTRYSNTDWTRLLPRGSGL